jgi:signal transduction histidine kinase
VIARVPALVVLLMIAVSAVITKQVLSRLEETQTRHFQELTSAYLDGLSSSLIPAVLRGDVWESFDILERAKSLYSGLQIKTTIVTNQDGSVLAAADPKSIAAYSKLPEEISSRFEQGQDLWLNDDRAIAGARRTLFHQGQTIGAIYAEFDVAALFHERRSVLWTLIGTNALIALGLALIGYLAVRRILKPIRILTDHLHQAATAEALPIAERHIGPKTSEIGQLFRRFNDLIRALQEREIFASRLAQDDRLSSLGRLTSGMAHEINNPLGGLFNAIDTLQRHGHDPQARDQAISLLDRGLKGIRDVVRAALVTYRVEKTEGPLTPSDIDDLAVLVRPELQRRELKLAWKNEINSNQLVRAGAIRQATLNLLLNACQATPPGGVISLRAWNDHASITITITDGGPGLDAERARYLVAAEDQTTPRPGEAGLGLWIIRRLVTEARGYLDVAHTPEGGTAITIAVPQAQAELRHVA